MRDNGKIEKQGNHTVQTLLLINMFLILCAAIGILGILKWKGPRRETEYRYVSLSEEAAARAYIWLDRIEDMPLDYAQIKELFGDIRLTVVLTPAKERDRYVQSIAEGSYEECLEQAERGMERAYREVVRYRLEAAGAEGATGGSKQDAEGSATGGSKQDTEVGSTGGSKQDAGGSTDEMLDELMKEAYGVTVAEYLAACDISLLPALEELTERYSGEVEHE